MKCEKYLSAVLAVILLAGTFAPSAVNAASEEESGTFPAETTITTETSQAEITTAAEEPEVALAGASTSEPSITPAETEQNPIESAPVAESQVDLFDVLSTVVTVALAPSIAGKTEYYTNESFVANFDIDLSSSTESILNPKIVITLPSTYLYSIQASDLQGQTSKTITTANGITTVTYTFNQLTGGTTMRVPMIIQTQAYVTPGGYVLPINASLMAADGSVIKAAAELDITSKVIAPTVVKRFYNSSADNQVRFGGTADPGNSNLISTTGASKQYFSVCVKVPSNGTGNSNAGGRRYASIRVTDKLPAGAVFVAADNPTWTYDAATNTVTCVKTGPFQTPVNGVEYELNCPLWLTFPGADTRNAITNTMDAEFVVDNKQDYETNFSASDSIAFKLSTTLPGVYFSKSAGVEIYDSVSSKAKNIPWALVVGNYSTDLNLENVVVTDKDLDSRLEYVSAQLSPSTTGLVGKISIEAIDSVGVSTILAADISAVGSTVYPIPAGTVQVRMSTTPGSYVLPGKLLYLIINTRIKDPDNTHTSVLTYFTNGAQITEKYQGINTPLSGTVTARTSFLPYSPKIIMAKSVNKATVMLNDILTFTLDFYNVNGSNLLPPDVVYGQQIIDLLPDGLSYVPNSTVVSNPYNTPGNGNLLASKEPVAVNNYKGTGRTALIWTFANPINGVDASMRSLFRVSFQTKVLSDTQMGVNQNRAYFTWENNGSGSGSVQQVKAAPAWSSYIPGKDTLDFDGDGNTTEDVLTTSANFSYIPPREVIASKYVKGTLDTVSVLTGGRTNVGDTAVYSLKVFNNSIVALNQLTVIDVLPYVGDVAIAPDPNGVYQPRNSSFPVYLAGPVTVPTGYTVYYTMELPTGTPSSYANNAAWVETPADYAAVKGIKVVMNPGTTLASVATVLFDVPVKVPSDSSLQKGQKIYNSFAISINAVDYLEAKVSSLEIYRYTVTGTAFTDLDRNGSMTSADTKLSGTKVWLLDTNGSPVLDLSGNPITGTTAADGTYKFDVFRPGQYKVAFEKPDHYTVTTIGAVSDATVSHILAPDASTDMFTLDTNTTTSVRNAGFYSVYGDIQIVKTLKDNAGSVLTEKRDFTCEILLNGAAYTGNVIINGIATAVVNGQITFHNGDDVWIRNITEGTSYEIREVNAEDYTVEAVNSTGTIQAYDKIVLTLTNTEKALGTLTITKDLRDNKGSVMPDTRTFTIVVTGPSYPDGREMTLTNGTPLVLSNMIYGSYTVTEKNADDYTVSVSAPVTLSVGSKTASITVSNAENASASLSITTGLRDYLGALLTDTRSFTIIVTGPSYPAGQEMTIVNGTPLVLSNLIYGSYTVKEKDADDYTVSVSVPAVLSVSAKTGSLAVTYTEKPLGSLTITKDLRDNQGNLLSDVRNFTIVVTGPSYPEGKEMTMTSGKSLILTGLVYGSYTVTETGADDYAVAVSAPVTLRVDAKIGSITITNTEKALGALIVTKEVRDNQGVLLTEERNFVVVITGPSYPSGKMFTLSNAQALVMDGLIYGGYSVQEVGSGEYTTTVSDPVLLTIGSRRGEITLVNTQNPLGEITVRKVLLSAEGKLITEERSFEVKLTGPSYPNGKTFAVSVAEPLVVKGLIYGTYELEELNTDKYEVVITKSVTLRFDQKAGEFLITNTEKKTGELEIIRTVYDSSGKVIPDARTFTVLVTGPSFPNGKLFEVSTTQPLKLSDLIYGIYTVVEQNTGDYSVTYTGSGTISLGSPQSEVKISHVLITKTSSINRVSISKTGEEEYELRTWCAGFLSIAGVVLGIVLIDIRNTRRGKHK